jgi:hypothetical protein
MLQGAFFVQGVMSMGSLDNLQLITPGKDAREKGRRGGRASGRARRKKKTMREAFAAIKDLPLNIKDLKSQLIAAGITDTEATYGMAMAYMTFVKAMQGNPQMMRLAMEMLGENDVQGVNKAAPKIEVSFSDEAEK